MIGYIYRFIERKIIHPSLKKVLTCLCLALFFPFQTIYAQTPVFIQDKGKTIAVFIAEKGENISQLKIYKKGSASSLLGKIIEQHDSLFFKPILPFQAGLDYQLREAGSVIFEFNFQKEVNAQTPIIERVYPSSDTLPANLLKFYIQFSQPMAEGDPYPFIQLLDAQQDPIPKVFSEQLPALWNADNTVLTLWLDPGRIKRELVLNKLYGNPLEAQSTYSLHIQAGLKDRNGQAIQAEFVKPFTTIEADRNKPSLASWQLEVPSRDSNTPLKIHFNESMDWRATEGRIRIVLDDQLIEGEASFDQQESIWRLIPAKPWKSGEYTIEVEAIIEDLAGNNLNRLFDRDIEGKGLSEKGRYFKQFSLK